MPGASALDRPATQHRGAEAGPPGTNAAGPKPFGSHFDEVLQARRDEAEEFYKAITPASLNADEAKVKRQALAGMLRSKHIRKPDNHLDGFSERQYGWRNKPTPTTQRRRRDETVRSD
jgi:hypothetical protein